MNPQRFTAPDFRALIQRLSVIGAFAPSLMTGAEAGASTQPALPPSPATAWSGASQGVDVFAAAPASSLETIRGLAEVATARRILELVGEDGTLAVEGYRTRLNTALDRYQDGSIQQVAALAETLAHLRRLLLEESRGTPTEHALAELETGGEDYEIGDSWEDDLEPQLESPDYVPAASADLASRDFQRRNRWS